jgi:Flp pilus assembly protein TadD
VLCNSKQVKRGRGLLQEARKIEPRSPHILSDLAANCLDTGEFELARRYAAEARSLAPDDPLIQSLGLVTEQVAPEADW